MLLLFKPCANGRNIVESFSFYLHVAKGLSGFKLCATSPNNMQLHATSYENRRNM